MPTHSLELVNFAFNDATVSYCDLHYHATSMLTTLTTIVVLSALLIDGGCTFIHHEAISDILSTSPCTVIVNGRVKTDLQVWACLYSYSNICTVHVFLIGTSRKHGNSKLG